MPRAFQLRRYRPLCITATCFFMVWAGHGPPVTAQVIGPREAGSPQPLVSTRNVEGETGTPIRLVIDITPPPGTSTLKTYLLGVPMGARLADPTHELTAADEDSFIDVTNWRLPELSVTLRPDQAGTFLVTVAALSITGDNQLKPIVNSSFTIVAKPHRPSLSDQDTSDVAQPTRTPDPTPGPSSSANVYIPHLDAVTSSKEQPLRVQGTESAGRNQSQAQASAPRLSTTGSTAPTPSEPNPATLVERAEQLIRTGNISGARRLLERAMARDEPRAAFLLAQTCDPKMLRMWKVLGLQPDPERARSLYARAGRDGITDPKNLAAVDR